MKMKLTSQIIGISQCTLALITIIMMVSCNSSVTNIYPTAPKPGVIHTPAFGDQLSQISLPISYDISNVKPQVEAGVSSGKSYNNDYYDIIGDDPAGDVGLKWEWRRDGLSTNFIGNQLDLCTSIHYRADFSQRIPANPLRWIKIPVGGYTWVHICGCGDSNDLKSINLGIRTTFTFKPDYRLEAHSTIANINPTSRCTVCALNYDITDKFLGKVSSLINTKIPDIDTYLNSRLSFRSQAQQAWDALQTPIEVGKNMYLLIQPKGMSVSPINGNGNILSTSIGLTAQPRFILGPKPTVSNSDLPPLTDMPPGNGFNIALRAEVGYKEATNLLTKELTGKSYSIGSDYSVQIDTVRLYGTNTKSVLGVSFTGGKKSGFLKDKVKGRLYLEGVPNYDLATQTLLVRDLAYTLDTRNLILKLAAWLNNKIIIQAIQSKAKFPVADKLVDAKNKLQQAINRDINPHVSVSGNVDGLTPLGVTTSLNGIQAVALTKGNVQLTIR